MRLLALPGLPGKDAADALGLAICHAHAGASLAAARPAHAVRSGAATPHYRKGTDLLSRAVRRRRDGLAQRQRSTRSSATIGAPVNALYRTTPESSTPAG